MKIFVIGLSICSIIVVSVLIQYELFQQTESQLDEVAKEQEKNIEKEKAINANLDSMESSLLQLQTEINSNDNTAQIHHDQSYLSNTTWYFSDQTKLAVSKLKVGDCYDGDSVMGMICKIGTYP